MEMSSLFPSYWANENRGICELNKHKKAVLLFSETMGLQADGWKKNLISLGSRAKVKNDMLKEDYPREVAVAEDANISLYMLTYYTETLHDLEVKVCARLQKWLYDPVTRNRNNVVHIEWVYDYDPPVIKQLVQKSRDTYHERYSDVEVADMWLSGELDRMFDHVKARNQQIGLDKIVYTRPLFPLLVKYVTDFLKNRLTHDMILKPGDKSFTLHVCSAVSEATIMVEPRANSPIEHYTPLTSKKVDGRCKTVTKRYSFSRDPMYRISYTFSSPRRGEAEVKLVSSCQRYYVQRDIRDFFIACKDTDVIPLFLLNHHQMIPDSTVHILLDEGSTKYRKEELYVSVQGLAQDIEAYFATHATTVDKPVVFMCCWMVLTGTDFVENISGMDAAAFMSFLRKHVNRILKQFEGGQQPFFDDGGVTVFSEHLVYRMILEFHSQYPESSQGKPAFQAKLKEYPPQSIEDLYHLTIDKGKKRYIQDSTDKVYSKIRRSSYNVHYWERGARMEPVIDPLSTAQVGDFHLPLFGYYLDQNNEVKMSDVVART